MIYPLRKEYLICYDVEDTKIRTKIYKELQKYGMSAVQKSVFWGYLTNPELLAVKRFITEKLNNFDKAFITHSNLNGKGQSFLIGHRRDEFTDWEESDVI